MSTPIDTSDDDRYTGNSIALIKNRVEKREAIELLRRHVLPETTFSEPDLFHTRAGRTVLRLPVTYNEVKWRKPNPEVLLIERERRLYLRRPEKISEPTSAGREHELTWALSATRVGESSCTGSDVAVAVLDTGLDRRHPDFVGRVVDDDFESFVGGTADDRDGHGTHCAGIACGPGSPKGQPRYGVAPDARLIIGKVLERDNDVAFDYALLGGMVWANLRGADVISLSLEGERRAGEPHSEIFEFVAAELRSFGTIIVAATGSSNDRPSYRILPIQHPADCPTILATAAVDEYKKVANSSCGKVGKQRDPAFAAPGVSILSAVPVHPGSLKPPYGRATGTSAAAPHAAGIAALWIQHATRHKVDPIAGMFAHLGTLTDPRADIGDGLVQAPV